MQCTAITGENQKKNVGMLCEGMYVWLVKVLQPEPIFGHIVNEVVTVKRCLKK